MRKREPLVFIIDACTCCVSYYPPCVLYGIVAPCVLYFLESFEEELFCSLFHYLYYEELDHATSNDISHLSNNTLGDNVCHFYLEALGTGPDSASVEKVADLKGMRNRFCDTNLAYGRLD